MEGYSTVSGTATASFIEKKSEFIGYISAVQTAEEAVAYINEIRSQHRRATHNVYAYVLRDGGTSRYSDDGEPQGTAGVPVLEVLNKEGITDVCCVVTRYFGGILLGGGGLVRAYSHAAKLALDASVRRVMLPCHRVDVKVDYSLYGKVDYCLPEFGVKLLSSSFGSDVELSFLVKKEHLAILSKKLTDITNANIHMCISNEMVEDFA